MSDILLEFGAKVALGGLAGPAFLYLKDHFIAPPSLRHTPRMGNAFLAASCLSLSLGLYDGSTDFEDHILPNARKILATTPCIEIPRQGLATHFDKACAPRYMGPSYTRVFQIPSHPPSAIHEVRKKGPNGKECSWFQLTDPNDTKPRGFPYENNLPCLEGLKF